MVKTALLALAFSSLAATAFTMTEPETNGPKSISTQDLYFDQINMDALLFAPVIDELDRKIGHVEEILIAADGSVDGYVVSTYTLVPVFPEETLISTQDTALEVSGPSDYRLRVRG